MARVGTVDQDNIIDSRVGSELRQHFLFGVEVVMNDLNASAFLEHFEGPGFIRPIALPVEDTNLCCTNHGTPKDQHNQPLEADQFQ